MVEAAGIEPAFSLCQESAITLFSHAPTQKLKNLYANFAIRKNLMRCLISFNRLKQFAQHFALRKNVSGWFLNFLIRIDGLVLLG